MLITKKNFFFIHFFIKKPLFIILFLYLGNKTQIMHPNFKGLRTCIYKVSNLELATEWYSNLFNTNPYFKAACYVGFNISGFELGLEPDTASISHKTDNVLVYWGVADILLMFNRCIELGGVIHEAPRNVGENIVLATIKDTWNNVIGLIYNPHFKQV